MTDSDEQTVRYELDVPLNLVVEVARLRPDVDAGSALNGAAALALLGNGAGPSAPLEKLIEGAAFCCAVNSSQNGKTAFESEPLAEMFRQELRRFGGDIMKEEA